MVTLLSQSIEYYRATFDPDALPRIKATAAKALDQLPQTTNVGNDCPGSNFCDVGTPDCSVDAFCDPKTPDCSAAADFFPWDRQWLWRYYELTKDPCVVQRAREYLKLPFYGYRRIGVVAFVYDTQGVPTFSADHPDGQRHAMDSAEASQLRAATIPVVYDELHQIFDQPGSRYHGYGTWTRSGAGALLLQDLPYFLYSADPAGLGLLISERPMAYMGTSGKARSFDVFATDHAGPLTLTLDPNHEYSSHGGAYYLDNPTPAMSVAFGPDGAVTSITGCNTPDPPTAWCSPGPQSGTFWNRELSPLPLPPTPLTHLLPSVDAGSLVSLAVHQGESLVTAPLLRSSSAGDAGSGGPHEAMRRGRFAPPSLARHP